MLVTAPHFDLKSPKSQIEGIKKPIITSKGSIPIIEDFKEKEIYKNVGIYSHTRISNNEFLFRPTEKQIREKYLSEFGNLDFLIGKKCHTEEARAIFNKIAHNFQPTEEQYFEQIIKNARKINFIGNEWDIVLKILCLHIHQGSDKIPFRFSPAFLYEAIEYAQLKKYKELKKALVFNQNHPINPIARTYYQNIAVGQINTESLKELLHLNLTVSQYAEILGCSTRTVERNLQKLGISTKGNKKENAYKTIQKWRKENRRGTQKQCALDLEFSERKVKMYWHRK